mmetsp:Transcript_33169/g.40780  ORF Transcript_33169/g.40780 Transcript_33169/m.40780 type:complete len:95 (+) Transcript_33169:341-625(+)
MQVTSVAFATCHMSANPNSTRTNGLSYAAWMMAASLRCFCRMYATPWPMPTLTEPVCLKWLKRSLYLTLYPANASDFLTGLSARFRWQRFCQSS